MELLGLRQIVKYQSIHYYWNPLLKHDLEKQVRYYVQFLVVLRVYIEDDLFQNGVRFLVVKLLNRVYFLFKLLALAVLDGAN